MRKPPPSTKGDGQDERPDHAAIRDLQRTAGNKAVTTLLTEARTVQREPGNVNVTNPPGHVGGAVAVDNLEVVRQFARDRTKVIRSPKPDWHAEMWRLDGGKGDPPKAFKVGDIIAVAPDLAVPATSLPRYSAPAPHALETAAATAATVPVTSSEPRPGMATVGTAPPPPQQGRRPVVGRPKNWDIAKPATPDEVEAVYKQDPSSVMRSPSDYWHEQMYDLDKGEGDDVPQVFRVGGKYLVAPGYKGQATPLDPAADAARIKELTKGASFPGMLMHDQSRFSTKTITTSESGGQTTDRVSHRKLGSKTDTTTVTTGDVTHTTETKKGVKGAGYGTSTTDTHTWSEGGESATRTSSSNKTVGLGKGGVKFGAAKSNETVVQGPVPKDATKISDVPDPVKAGSHTTGSVTVGPNGASADASHSSTSANGRTTSVGGGGTVDTKGNYDVSANAGIKGKGGAGATATVGKGHHITAEDPVEVSKGVWEVRYVVNDSTSLGAGGSAPVGGASAGVDVGRTDATLHTGSRRFASEKEALAFKKDPGVVEFDSIDISTAAGALKIPVGEARGTGGAHGSSFGVSGSFEGASLGWGTQSSKGSEVTVRHVGPTLVQITNAVSAGEGSDWTAGGLGLSNSKGDSTSSLYEVTYEFDLASDAGKASYERYCRSGLPPADARRVSVHTLDSKESHDKYGFVGGYGRNFGGKTWKDTTVDDKGTTTKHGGAQTDDQTPGWVGGLLGDKEFHSNAQIVRTGQNGKDAGGRAELDVSGESGSHNREEFAKIFGTEGTVGDATASGKWTLTAQVPAEAIREAEQVWPSMRAAKTMDEKMALYSQLVKEHGANMLGGQVGMTSTAWNLELKGDENFPGEAGRDRLNQLAKDLRAQLTAKPASSFTIVNTIDDELRALQRRRKAVADVKQYTDLPGRLRKEQLAVIDGHIADLGGVRRNALALSMRQSGGEAKAGDGGAAKIRDQNAKYEAQIGTLAKQIRKDSKAITPAIKTDGRAAIRIGTNRDDADYAISVSQALLKRAVAKDAEHAALDSGIDTARNGWQAATDPKDRLTQAKALNALLASKVKLMQECIDLIHESAKAIGPVTTDRVLKAHPDFWSSLGFAIPDD